MLMTHMTSLIKRKNDINNAAKHIYIICSLYKVTIHIVCKVVESSEQILGDEGFLNFQLNHCTPLLY